MRVTGLEWEKHREGDVTLLVMFQFLSKTTSPQFIVQHRHKQTIK